MDWFLFDKDLLKKELAEPGHLQIYKMESFSAIVSGF